PPARQTPRSADVLPRLAARLAEKNPVLPAAGQPCAPARRCACAPSPDPASPQDQARQTPCAADTPPATPRPRHAGNAPTTGTNDRSELAAPATALPRSPQPPSAS